jgi:hypothetical protein
MDHYQPPRRHASALGCFLILLVRIGDVHGSVELAVGVSPIKRVDALRRPIVPFGKFVANRLCAQSYVKASDNLTFALEVENTIAFVDHNKINRAVHEPRQLGDG